MHSAVSHHVQITWNPRNAKKPFLPWESWYGKSRFKASTISADPRATGHAGQSDTVWPFLLFHTISHQVIYPPDMNFEDDLAKVSLTGGSVQRAGRWEAKQDNSIFRVMEMPVHSSVPRWCSKLEIWYPLRGEKGWYMVKIMQTKDMILGRVWNWVVCSTCCCNFEGKTRC